MEQNQLIDEYMKPLDGKLLIENKRTSQITKLLTSLKLLSSFQPPIIKVPTKINSHKNTVIDNIFTNHIHPDMKSGNLTLAISDHLPSFLVFPRDIQNHMPKKQDLFTRKTKKIDRVNFILNYLEWNKILELNKNYVNVSLKIFFTKINELLNRYMPLRKVTPREYKRRFKPWITDNILQKNKAFKKYMKCKLTQPILKEQINAKYKAITNEITALSQQCKNDYYNQYFTENKDNLQKVWNGIKEIVNIKSKNHNHPTCILENNKTITSPREIANSINRYYTPAVSEILKARKYEGNKSHTDFLTNLLAETFVVYECDQTEIEIIINSLNPRKAIGPNSIPTDILHLLKKEISYQLTKIFNISLSNGVYPDLFKIAKAIPIFKTGSQLCTSNYRPISLLSNLNKILEKLRLYEFLEKYNCIHKLQFGFRKDHSTNHALIEITETYGKHWIKMNLDVEYL